MHSFEAKIVVLGQQGVGKSSVIVRYLEGTFSKNLNPTIGASFFTCKTVLDDYRIKLQIWDTAGQERFRAMAPLYYRTANAAFIMYDITSEESFQDVKNWVKELRRNSDRKTAICIMGNKADLHLEREVDTEVAKNYAASIHASHFETSAATGKGISAGFCQISRQLIANFEESKNDFMLLHNHYEKDTNLGNSTHLSNLSAEHSERRASVDTTKQQNCCS